MDCKKRNTSNQLRFLFTSVQYLSLIVILLSCATLAASQDRPSLSVKLSKTSFPLNSATALTITVNGSQSADINIPTIENLVFHRRGQSTQVQVINGSVSSSITSTFIVQAKKEGQYLIPAIEVNVEGQLLLTNQLSFQVTADSSVSRQSGSSTGNQSDGQRATDVAFIHINGMRDQAFIGEIIPIEIKTYFQSGLRAEIHELPTLDSDGFVMSPLTKEAQQNSETYMGKNYSVITWQTTLSPIKQGQYDLVINLDATLLFPQRNARSRFNDPFFSDDFFSGFFGGFQRKNVALATPKQSIHILPLPMEGKPENFSGPVGHFEFEVSADPTSIDVGDPITLTMKISGRGNFDRITAPQFPVSDNWKTYSPSSQFIDNGSNYEGEKIFEQAIVAKSGVVNGVPPLTFNYFDPIKKRYISRISKPLPLTVQSGSSQQFPPRQTAITPPTPVTKEQQLNNRLPLASIRLQPGSFLPEIRPVFSQIWYIITIVCCSLILLMVLYTSLRRRYIDKNSTLLEKKRVNRMVAAKIIELQRAINENNGQDFLRGCRQVIQAQLGLLWRAEPSAITPVDLQKRLPSHSPLIHIFAAAEQYTYGGGRLSTDEMTDYLQLLKKELEELS